MKRESNNKNRITKARDFFQGLQKSWKEAKKLMKMAKEAMKK